MADFAATAGKTDDMTHANTKIVPPARHENRMAARAYALVMRWLVRLAALITVAILVFLIGYILVNGIPNLKPSLFEWTYNSDNVSLMPALINTILMTAFSLAIATPLGIFAAVWLVEYAKRGSKLVKVVRITTETLQGIPSIVYGLFGMLFFVMQLKWGYSLIAGAFTLAIMVLPVIMRTTEEALLAVPDSYREGSFGLGAGKLRTVFTIVLPSAMPGILSGVILATGRIVGETAALIYTASTVAAVPASVFNSTRTLATHMYLLSNEGLHINETWCCSSTACPALLPAALPKSNAERNCMMNKFEVKNMDLYYGSFHALKNINIAIPEKEITAFIGPSGCGKSTFLKSLNRMNDLVEGCRISGDILLDGVDIYKDKMDVNVLRKRVGMVFQKPNPFPMSIYDNIAYGPRTHGVRSKAQLDEIVEKSLRGAAIWDEVKDRLNKSALGMSGGQQQRLCIARALAVEPEVLLMDEPTSALDPISTSKVEELALELKDRYTIIIVTHNMQQAARISDKTAFFLLGELVEMGDTERLFSTPVDKRTEDYISGRFG